MPAKERFTIQEVAKLNNISIDSLRYYERIGLLTPSRGNNRYRYYSLDDLVLLNIIKEFRSLNFSFPQIKEMLDNRTLANTQSLLIEELSLVEEEIARLRQIKKTLHQRINNLNSVFCQLPTGTPSIISLPDMKCLHITKGPIQIDEIDYYISQYTEQTGLDISNIIGRYDVYQLNPHIHINDTECVIEDVLVTNNAMKIKPDVILEHGQYLCVTYNGTQYLSGIQTNLLLEYIQEKHLIPSGNFYEFRIFDFYDTTEPDEYLSAVCVRLQQDSVS